MSDPCEHAVETLRKGEEHAIHIWNTLKGEEQGDAEEHVVHIWTTATASC